jgi:hypothetical protein
MKQFFRTKYSWDSVYYHFQKWCKNGSWQRLSQILLVKFKSVLDLSTIQLDGTHTTVKRGGEAVEYQGRRKCRTSNMLILVENNGISIAFSGPIVENQNDSFELVANFETMINPLKKSNIRLDGLFLDVCFNITKFRECCYKNDIIDNIKHNIRNGKYDASFFDDELYKKTVCSGKNQCLGRLDLKQLV